MSSDAGFWRIPPEAFPMTTSTASNVVLDFHDGTDAINHEGVAASTAICFLAGTQSDGYVTLKESGSACWPNCAWTDDSKSLHDEPDKYQKPINWH